jgi:tRNA (guanine10-N2)-dimethyltransferase
MDRLGGTVKIAREIINLNSSKVRSLEDTIIENVADNLASLPDGKINFGISYYGNNQTVRDIERIALNVKRFIKKSGRSIRIIPNKEVELSSAQIFHNKLTGKAGFELIIIATDTIVTFAKTIAVQNIEAYTSRDQKRPYRDAKIGMLPPKLAQIMINLVNPTNNATVLDPFCGTGVVLQESLIMGLQAIGTDIDSRMVDYSENNIKWLRQRYNNLKDSEITYGDATDHVWHKKIDCVVSETYLGHPFFQVPSINLINKETLFVNDLLARFLKNIYSQIEPETKLCLAIPAWRYNDQFIQLPLLDQLEEIGYNPMSFKNLKTKDLIYYRPNQVVARQMLLLIRK